MFWFRSVPNRGAHGTELENPSLRRDLAQREDRRPRFAIEWDICDSVSTSPFAHRKEGSLTDEERAALDFPLVSYPTENCMRIPPNIISLVLSATAVAATTASTLQAAVEKPVPAISLWVDGKSYDGPRIQGIIGEDGKLRYGVDSFVLETPDFLITLSSIMDPDPSIAYGIAVTDFGAPSTFMFLFSTPIVPTGFPNQVNASLVGGLTDFTGNGVSITPTGAFVQTSSLGLPITSMAVDVGTAFAAGPGNPGALYPYGAFSAGPIPGPGPGPWTVLQTLTDFKLSGGGDIAVLTGFAQIVTAPVPEAGTGGSVLLLGTLAAGYWRRHRAAQAK